MRKNSNFLYWAPRALSLILILFLFFISLDVFQSGLSFQENLIFFFEHNIVTIFLAISLILAWRIEIIGGVMFPFVGILYLIFIMDNMIYAGFKWSYLWSLLKISGITILIGALFSIYWFKKKKVLL